jgi:endonuclease/exonuclease/phosphatase family metal-dependent hydrolase
MTIATISVLTLNVWNREGDWARRKPLVRACIATLQPDLIGLCEVKDREHVREILGDDYSWEWHGGEISGIAIAARWPLSDVATCALPGDGDAPGGAALRARAQSPIGPIGFTCATTFFFMSHHGYKRELQMPQLADFARQSLPAGGFPPILVGDFNADPESAEIRFLKGLQSLGGRSAYFCDAWEHAGDGGKGATWSNANPSAAIWHWPDRRIDYILVGHPRRDGAGRIASCTVVANQEVGGTWPSDHFGVSAVLRTAV